MLEDGGRWGKKKEEENMRTGEDRIEIDKYIGRWKKLKKKRGK